MKKIITVLFAVAMVVSLASCLSYDSKSTMITGGESWWYNKPVNEVAMVDDVVSNMGDTESVVFYKADGAWRKDVTNSAMMVEAEAYKGPKMVVGKTVFGAVRTKVDKEPKDIVKLYKTYSFFGFANGLTSSGYNFLTAGVIPALYEKQALFQVTFQQAAWFQKGPTEMVYVDAIPAGMTVKEVFAVKGPGFAKIAGMTKYEVVEKAGASYVVVKIGCDKPINLARIAIVLDKE